MTPRGVQPLAEARAAESPVTAARAMVDALVAQGIDRVFAIPGGPISPIVDALLDTGVQLVACQHETLAVYIATGYARATGRPGVVLVTSGPGVLNAVTGLAAARLDEAPVVVLVGEVALSVGGRVALQDGSARALDIGHVTATLAKGTWLVERPGAAASQTRAALRLAACLPQGPVVVRVPVDVARSAVRKQSVAPSVSRAAVAGPPSAETQEVARTIAKRLVAAHRAVIMLGGRAAVECLDAVEALARGLGIGVFTDLEAKGLFPESHPRSLGVFGLGSDGRAEAYLAGGVDCVLVMGARLDDTTTANFSPLLRPLDGFVAQLDIAADRLGRSYDVDLAWHGDLRSLLEHVVTCVRPRLLRPLRHSTPVGDPPKAMPPLRGGGLHDPRHVPAALQRAFPEHTIYTCDIGNHLLFCAQGMRLDRPRSLHVSMGLGGMGSGIGMGIGLALGQSHRRVVSICGDGSMLMVGNELATCVRYQIPITFAVFNDGQWGMVAHGTEQVYRRSHDWSTPTWDLVAYARSLGARTHRIEDELGLQAAAAEEGVGPCVLEFRTDPGVRVANPRDATLNFGSAAPKCTL